MGVHVEAEANLPVLETNSKTRFGGQQEHRCTASNRQLMCDVTSMPCSVKHGVPRSLLTFDLPGVCMRRSALHLDCPLSFKTSIQSGSMRKMSQRSAQ